METKKYNARKSIERADKVKSALEVNGQKHTWSTRMERVKILRKGLPYDSIEVVSERASMHVKQLLTAFHIPQTTYNKRKKENELLNLRDSEAILMLTELLDFGIVVFNEEEDKFISWLKKPNISLGGNTPESLFDSLTGIQEVKNALNRLEYGNMA